jgi:uncharacterized protein (DUF302 family)
LRGHALGNEWKEITVTQATEGLGPENTKPIDGIIHSRSPLTVDVTVDQLKQDIAAAEAKLFAVIDHSGEAKLAGLPLRETKLLVFGNPAAGTPVMQVEPVAALDLPLKVLVWSDEAGAVWMTYSSPSWLAERYGLKAELAKPLSATQVLTSRIANA